MALATEPSRRPVVLIIEDSPAIQQLIAASVAPLGVEILFAGDGQLGLDLARQHHPEVTLLDIGLPVLDGWRVLAALRADPATVHLAVMVVTAQTEPGVAEAAGRRGADGLMTKPFRPTDLRLRVEELLTRTHGESASLSA